MGKLAFWAFEQIMLTDLNKRREPCIEICFDVDLPHGYRDAWMGKMKCRYTSKDLYWFGLVPDGSQAHDFYSFEELVSAKVFCGKSLKEVWDSIFLISIDASNVREVLPLYLDLPKDGSSIDCLHNGQPLYIEDDTYHRKCFSYNFSYFEQMIKQQYTSVTAEFFIDEDTQYGPSRMGKTIDYDTNSVSYWLEMALENSCSYTFDSFEQLVNTEVFHGKSLKEVWNAILFHTIHQLRNDNALWDE